MDDKYDEIIRLIRTGAPVEPPPGFTERLMARLPEEIPQGVGGRLRAVLLYPHSAGVRLLEDLAGGRREVAFFLAMAGFFYCCLGLALFLGFTGPEPGSAVGLWHAVQLRIVFSLAGGLLVLGGLQSRPGGMGWLVLKSVVVLWAGVVIINGIAEQVAVGIPLLMAGIFFWLGAAILGSGLLILFLRAWRREKQGQWETEPFQVPH